MVVAEPTAPRGSWLMGRALEIKADAQGLVCTVKLQTKKNILERPTRFVSFMKVEPKGQTVSLAEKKRKNEENGKKKKKKSLKRANTRPFLLLLLKFT